MFGMFGSGEVGIDLSQCNRDTGPIGRWELGYAQREVFMPGQGTKEQQDDPKHQHQGDPKQQGGPTQPGGSGQQQGDPKHQGGSGQQSDPTRQGSSRQPE